MRLWIKNLYVTKNILTLIKANWFVLIAFSSLIIFCDQGQSALGFFIIRIIAFLTLLYQAFSCLYFWKSPKKVAKHLTAIAIVVILLLIVWQVKIYHNNMAKEKANQIIEAIEKFNLNNVRYPASLDELGINPAQVHQRFRLFYFIDNDGNNPILMRDSTFGIADYFIYNFLFREWVYQSP